MKGLFSIWREDHPTGVHADYLRWLAVHWARYQRFEQWRAFMFGFDAGDAQVTAENAERVHEEFCKWMQGGSPRNAPQLERAA